MRSIHEIEAGFRAAIKQATNSFIGEKSDKVNRDKIQTAVMQAVNNYYLNGITTVEKEYYEIRRPSPRVVINGSEVTIEG